MQRILYYLIDAVDFILPWTIVVPFSMFTFGSEHLTGKYTSCVAEIRKLVVQDLKSGLIRELFLKVWLRENTLNRVVFNNNDFKIWGLDLFQKVARNNKVQQQIEILVSRTTNVKELYEKVNRGFTKQKGNLSSKFWESIDSVPGLKTDVFARIFKDKMMKRFEVHGEEYSMDYEKMFNLLR